MAIEARASDAMERQPIPTIVVVGAGFSGAMAAVQLVRKAEGPLHVLLVNESGRMGRGLAYGTHSAQHLLNVPAGNMSALMDDPDDFLRYCRWSAPEVQPDSFVTRRAYGAYLEALLSAAEVSLKPAVRLERVTGTVVSARPDQDRVKLSLADGRQWLVDKVVLAFGHFAPLDPLPADRCSTWGPRWIRDPWAPGALAGVRPDDDVLLIGTGLTAVDMALALREPGRRGRITCISRRGLLPQPHRRSGGLAHQVDGAALVQAMGSSLRQYVRAVRQAASAHVQRGGDWRDVVGALRPHTPRLWQGLCEADRARFLRHVRPYWDVLRHRCAPEAYEAFDQLVGAGRLELLAARIHHVAPSSDGALDVVLQLRAGRGRLERRVQHIVNCTGPSSDLRRSTSPLLAQLRQLGLLQADALGLGLVVNAAYQPQDAQGESTPWLYYIGPLLKARDWEAVAVPELRVHASRLADHLLRR